MVVTFLAVLLAVEIIGGVTLWIASKDDNNAVGFYAVGWLVGAFTSATCYVLFYQIWPHVGQVAG